MTRSFENKPLHALTLKLGINRAPRFVIGHNERGTNSAGLPSAVTHAPQDPFTLRLPLNAPAFVVEPPRTMMSPGVR